MAIEKADLNVVKSDALSPAETEAKAEGVGVTKAGMAPAKCFVSAMLAGAFIGFGGMFFCMFLGDSTLSFGVQRLVGGLLFCTGLSLVLICGAELFTGNSLMICAKCSNKITWGELLKNWGIVWLGNLVGALVAVFIIYGSELYLMNSGGVGEAFVSVAAGKVALEPLPLFCKAIMCNVLVCLAVWVGFASRTTTDRVIGILLPISAFVACGFEHCVANMFFLPTGLLLNTVAGIGAAGAVTLAGVAYNIAIATLGNVVGGILVGLPYWFIYHKKQESK